MKRELSKDRKHTIYNFLGIKIKRRRYAEYMIEQIYNNMRLPENIFKFRNTFFYLPNYPKCHIQNKIYNDADFYEHIYLDKLSKYLPDNAVIIDIGANIGNHSIYWGTQNSASKVYSFEAIKSTYDILFKNIELNQLNNIVIPFNIALSDENGNANSNGVSEYNIGSTSITKSTDGKIITKTLDSINLDTDRIDLIKIDVEGHEVNVLKGANETIKKYHPMIMIESFPEYFQEVNTILENHGYKMKKDFFGGATYFYTKE